MVIAKTPKYRDIRKDLESQILAGRWEAGSAFPTEAELLKRYPVSRMTLVRSLQELVQAGYLIRHRGRGTFVASLNGDAETNTTRRASRLLLPLFCFGNSEPKMNSRQDILSTTMTGVREALAGKAVSVQLCMVGASEIDPLVQQLLEQTRARAALVLEPHYNRAFPDFLRRNGCRPVIINDRLDDFDCAYVDQAQASYLATRHLLERGRRRIAYLGAPLDRFWVFPDRREGYLRACREAGVQIDPALVLESDLWTHTEAGRAMARQLLTDGTPFDALVACHCGRAVGAMATLQEAGLRIPADVAAATVGYRGITDAAGPLTAVGLPTDQAAHQATLQAIAMLQPDSNPLAPIRHVCIKPVFTVRDFS